MSFNILNCISIYKIIKKIFNHFPVILYEYFLDV